jgi:tetratricopeptide (TPR) repeat protein
MAIGMRKGGVRARPDLEFDAFLRDQRRLINLQVEHLHEQRQVTLLRLRLGSWKDRVTLALQALTAAVGLAVATAVAVMAWQAHEDHGVAIAAFSVPPDFAQKGLTGQVMASQLLDRLSDLQAQTVTARPASTYANDWGGDIKVEIPETGVSIGELRRYLREWLGHETRISGEVVRTSAGLAVTARAGQASGKRFEGNEADLDKLVGQAAEAVYAETQPYRYAVYLQSHGRRDDAVAAYRRLAASGSKEDRAWAYAGWATLASFESHWSEAERLAETALQLNPRLAPAHFIFNEALDLRSARQTHLAETQRELALLRGGGLDGLSKEGAASRQIFLNAVKARSLGDYRATIVLLSDQVGASVDFEGRAAGYDPVNLFADALVRDHDVTGARQATAGHNTMGPNDPSQFVELGDWAGLASLLDSVRGNPALDEFLQGELRATEALVYAHRGRFAEAEAALARSSPDCDDCLVARGKVAALKGDWPGADRWFAEAERHAPSIPFADAAWAQALLDKGDPDAAIAKALESHRRGPHFADPIELWGEALMRKGDYAGAVAKFAEADKYAPRWGRNHLRWGEALMLSRHYREARAQYEIANALDLSKPDRAALDVLLARTKSGPLHG